MIAELEQLEQEKIDPAKLEEYLNKYKIGLKFIDENIKENIKSVDDFLANPKKLQQLDALESEEDGFNTNGTIDALINNHIKKNKKIKIEEVLEEDHNTNQNKMKLISELLMDTNTDVKLKILKIIKPVIESSSAKLKEDANLLKEVKEDIDQLIQIVNILN